MWTNAGAKMQLNKRFSNFESNAQWYGVPNKLKVFKFCQQDASDGESNVVWSSRPQVGEHWKEVCQLV